MGNIRPEPSTCIVGIDPGKRRSGFVVISFEPVLGIHLAKRLPNPQAKDWIWENAGRIELVVVESFRLYPWVLRELAWNDLPEVRMIGGLEEVCRRCGLRLVLIAPADAKRTVTTKELRTLGLFDRNAHVTDGFRVIVAEWKKEGL